ncbi:hypothetical protein [Bradyrhizobium lablabi]|uniref:hypothetical protein n=1 Tax=Bradyrhizobium lablabi TaxID=722472 RepID=UPI001BA7AF72|nr:hypothetical protein [Bradyrhizobium lablabi]MBR0696736.1 hypothetical protein [Bradyrhizobium lablabi]
MASRNEDKQRGSAVEQLAREALEAFRADAPEDYDVLVKEYEGQSAVVGVFGMGSVNVAISRGEVHLGESEAKGKTRIIARGATYPETIIAMSRGEVTPLEAFHAGDLVVRAPSEELHKAFGFLVKFSASAVASKGLQRVLEKFKEQSGLK